MVVGSEGLAVGLQHLVVVSEGDLELVHALLSLAISLLSISLLLGHALVLLDDGSVMGNLASLVLVLEHTAHTEDSFFLLGPVLLLLSVHSGLMAVLTDLLVSPISLILCIEPHSIVVH